MKKLMLTAALASAIAIPGLVQAKPATPQQFPGQGATFKVRVDCTYDYYLKTIFYVYVGATEKDTAIEYAKDVADKFEYYYYGAECDVIRTNPGGVEKIVG